MIFAPFGRIDILPLLNYLEILDIKDIFLLETAKLIFKVKNDMIPIPIRNYFEVRILIIIDTTLGVDKR